MRDLATRRTQTVFMITHDVDEALLLADKILLMTNGPRAWIAEIVENTLPKERSRAELHKPPNYYPLRNHLIEFLVTRSRELACIPRRDRADRSVPSSAPPHHSAHERRPLLRRRASAARLRAAAFPRRKLLGKPHARPAAAALHRAASRPTVRLTQPQDQGARPMRANSSPRRSSTSSARRAGPGSRSPTRSAACRRCWSSARCSAR